MVDVSALGWMDYDGQSDEGFKYIQYINLKGEKVIEPVTSFDDQIAEVQRTCGKGVAIRLYY